MATGGGRKYRLMAKSLIDFVTHEILAALIGIVVAIVCWQLVTLGVHANWLPKPSSVASEAVELLGKPKFRSDLLSSLGIVITGFIVATVVGGLLGILMAISRVADLALRYYIDALLIVPPVALAPILVVVFGITSANIVALTVIFAIGLITVNSAAAVRGVDRLWIEVGQVFGASRAQLIRSIILPAVLPQFFAGLQLGLTRAYKGMIIGQVFLGVIGIGAYLALYQQAFDSAGIWAIGVMLIAVSLILTWCIKAVDHVVNYWAYRG